MFPQKLLSDSDIEYLKPMSSSYKRSVGKSLFILVEPNGGKYWRFKYHYNGKSKTLAIGVFPHVTLSTAIKLRDEAKELLEQGIDPSLIKREAKRIKTEMSKTPVFRMNISRDGELTIQNKITAIKLTKLQTEALKSFLNANQETYGNN
jgi:hypothetical protein